MSRVSRILLVLSCLTWRLGVVAAPLSLSACTRSLTVASTVSFPARAPVFVFPAVLVAGGKYEEEVYLLDRVAAYLARDPRREVRRLRAEELEPARQAGQISWLSAVLHLSLTLRSSQRAYSSMAPSMYCGPYGCNMTSYAMYTDYLPVLQGEVVLTVHEGPTARVLSRETLTDSVEGDADQMLRPALIERLAEDLLRAVDVHLQRVAFTLEETGIREADDGIAALSLGKYKAGRALLEGAAKTLGGKEKETQARVWHALGVSRIFAPSKPGADLADALRALKIAASVDADSRYSDSLMRVEALAKQYAVLREQQRAAEHNFKLAEEARRATSSN